MCLLALGWMHHPRWRLVMAGNRDEFHARPTAALAPWQDETSVIGGRDLRSGGGWAGVGASGRMAVVTNVRDPLAAQTGPSRGALVADFLRGRDPAAVHIDRLATVAGAYAPFNLLLADSDSLEYLGNHPAERQTLGPGVHGMSNGALDAPWPKTRRLMAALEAWLQKDGGGAAEAAAPGAGPLLHPPYYGPPPPDLTPLWNALADEHRPADSDLPDTGIGLERERWLSPAFIRGDDYGTRASTVLLIDADGHGEIHERRFGPQGAPSGQSHVIF
ncbi:NRDE family protein [Stenotrophomonas sp. Sm2017]|nr:NRDE family protein [Stenotrophomonas sp. Sm2017]MDQ7300670.1 NRDE family protein [Stenotrophomonas sp. Sm2017]